MMETVAIQRREGVGKTRIRKEGVVYARVQKSKLHVFFISGKEFTEI